MALRKVVEELLRDLSSDDERSLQATLLTTSLLLEQSNRYQGYRRAVRDKDLLGRLPANYTQRRRKAIRDEYRCYRDQGLFPERYLDLVLTDEEIDAITGALLGLLDRPPSTAADAAAALFRCGRLYAVSKLAEMVRRYAAIDADTAWNAIRALGAILRSSSMDPRRSLTLAQEQTVAEAIAALRFAAAEGHEGVLDARKAAEQELNWISEHFGRSF